MSNDPIHQFHITPLIPIEIAGVDASITNATVFMGAGVAATFLFFNWAMKPAALIPGRGQVAAEGAFSFVHDMVKDTTGAEGVKKFFPFVFSLFLFIFMANMIGMFPYFFTTTSQIGRHRGHGAHGVHHRHRRRPLRRTASKFFKLFTPSGVPMVHFAAGCADRDHLVLLATAQPLGSSVGEHSGRPLSCSKFSRASCRC